MRNILSVLTLFPALPLFHRVSLVSVLLTLALLLLTAKDDHSGLEPLKLSLNAAVSDDEITEQAETSTQDIYLLKSPWLFDQHPEDETLLSPSAEFPEDFRYQYQVQQGDTLSSIFNRLQIDANTMYQLLDADVNVLALDNLKPGHKLTFAKSAEELTFFELAFNPSHKVAYTRNSDKGFEFREIRLPGEWDTQLVAGNIEYSFTGSSQKAGLNAWEAQTVTEIMKKRIDFRKDIQRNDQFKILLSRQYVDQLPTGNTRIEAISIQRRNRSMSAYLFDGNYYDEKGGNLEKAFQRYPFSGKYRLSSHFNPRRKHPITGLIRPHNGTDFAMKKGSLVRVTGDGVVSRVVRHKYAGLYIEVKHGQSYKTRYLHLKKSYVIKGQRVKRGQKIALSGNSGRSSGPHLHYELHRKGRPVNPMTAAIPIAQTLKGKKKSAFRHQLKSYISQIKKLSSNDQLASREQKVLQANL